MERRIDNPTATQREWLWDDAHCDVDDYDTYIIITCDTDMELDEIMNQLKYE